MGKWVVLLTILGCYFLHPVTAFSIRLRRQAEADPNVDLLTKLGAKLDPKWFSEDDKTVLQKLDRINDISKYVNPENVEQIYYERPVLDTNAKVIVLTASEDKRGVNISTPKRTYTVLLKAPPIPDSKDAIYYLTYAYIRDARHDQNPDDIIQVGGRKITVEWDNYEERPYRSFHSGWSSCSNTFLFACFISEDAVAAAVQKLPPGEAPSLTNVTDLAAPKTAVAVKAQGNPNENIDLYGDFDMGLNIAGRGLLGAVGTILGGGPKSKTTTTTVVVKTPAGAAAPAPGLGLTYNWASGPPGTTTTTTKITTKLASSKATKKKKANATAPQGAMSWLPALKPPPPPPPPEPIPVAEPVPVAAPPAPPTPGSPPAPPAYVPVAAAPTPAATPAPAATPVVAPAPVPAPPGSPPAPPAPPPVTTTLTTTNTTLTTLTTITTKIESNADAVYGQYYKGPENAPPVFLPDGTDAVGAVFVPDANPKENLHGSYTPGPSGSPDTFAVDDAGKASVATGPGTIVLDKMKESGVKGGIHGTLTGENFKPDTPSEPMWFNPDKPEAKQVFTTHKKEDAPARPKETEKGEPISYGAVFPGVKGSSDVFVPDGQTISGTFVPADSTQKTIPHGQLAAAYPPGHGTFFAEDPKEVTSGTEVKGAFMPDNMNLTGALPGKMVKSGNSFVFHAEVPAKPLAYVKSNASKALWTPFSAPGEWVPPAPPPTPPPPPPKKKTNQAYMYGIKFPPMDRLEVFIPDDYPVDGQIIPEDPEAAKPQDGILIGEGKKPDKVVFQPKDPSLWPKEFSMGALFIPLGILQNNGVMGTLTWKGTGNASFISDPAGKGYWYIKGKPENLNVWTPFTPPAIKPKPPLIDRIQLAPYFPGVYVEGTPNEHDPGVFVPDAGAYGCFHSGDGAKSCGVYFPPRDDLVQLVSEFQEDTPSLANGAAGKFIPMIHTDKGDVEGTASFPCTFVAAQGEIPATLKPNGPEFIGWAQHNIKTNHGKTRTSGSQKALDDKLKAVNAAKHPSNKSLPVGGGFSGYPTNDKGLTSMVDPFSPVFLEYAQIQSRDDKMIDESDKVYIVANKENAKPDKGSAYIYISEYRNYLDERYTLKRTHIKSLDFEEMLEIAIPKAAEKYVKKKKNKDVKIKLDIKSLANAGAGAGAGAGGLAGGSGQGNVKGKKGGKECKGAWSNSATAIAQAANGSSATAQADAKQGGSANAMSQAKDGGNANSKANVTEGGMANAMSMGANEGNANSEANALHGANANALAKKLKGGDGTAVANAERLDKHVAEDPCGEAGALPDEIEVDSSAAASALSGNGTGGGSVSSTANTNVKIDMAGLAAKVMEMQSKLDEDDDDENPRTVAIEVNAASGATGAAGRSLADLDDESAEEKRQKLARITAMLDKAGVRIAHGWKTELRKIVPGVTLEFESEIFYGFGNCPHMPLAPLAQGEKDGEKVIDFYITKLRLYCNPKIKSKVTRLFNEGFLNFDESMRHFIIPSDNQPIKREKLTPLELRYLSTAFEFYIFSSTYHSQEKDAESKALAVYEGPDTGLPPATRSIRFLVKMALKFLEASRKDAPLHVVRLTRNLLNTLNSVLLKLYQDWRMVTTCQCEADVAATRNDQLHVMGLLQFVIHGTSAFDQGKDLDLKNSFKEFLVLNKEILSQKVLEYAASAPKI